MPHEKDMPTQRPSAWHPAIGNEYMKPEQGLPSPVDLAKELVEKARSIVKSDGDRNVILLDVVSVQNKESVSDSVWIERHAATAAALMCAHLCMRPESEEDENTILYMLVLCPSLASVLTDVTWDRANRIEKGIVFKKAQFSDRGHLMKYYDRYIYRFGHSFLKNIEQYGEFRKSLLITLLGVLAQTRDQSYIQSEEATGLTTAAILACEDYLSMASMKRPAFVPELE